MSLHAFINPPTLWNPSPQKKVSREISRDISRADHLNPSGAAVEEFGLGFGVPVVAPGKGGAFEVLRVRFCWFVVFCFVGFGFKLGVDFNKLQGLSNT